MKRASVQQEGAAKHQTLLQDFLELQKEFVSKKKKLQAAEQKRDTLLVEVRFLKRRRRFLLKARSSKSDQGNFKKSDTKRKIPEKEIKDCANKEDDGEKEPEVEKDVGKWMKKSYLTDN